MRAAAATPVLAAAAAAVASPARWPPHGHPALLDCQAQNLPPRLSLRWLDAVPQRPGGDSLSSRIHVSAQRMESPAGAKAGSRGVMCGPCSPPAPASAHPADKRRLGDLRPPAIAWAWEACQIKYRVECERRVTPLRACGDRHQRSRWWLQHHGQKGYLSG